MEFLVTENPALPSVLVTETLQNENYPGLSHYDMTNSQKEAVEEALSNTSREQQRQHLSPITSEDEDDLDSVISDDTIKSEREDNISREEPPPQRLPTITTLPTPDVFARVSDNHLYEELRREVTHLRKKVALSANMKSLMSRLEGIEDLNIRVDYIQSYAKRKFGMQLTREDFEALSDEEVQQLYKKAKNSERSDRYDVIYKTVFDFSVSSLETLLNKYVFAVKDLNTFILYDDISHELNDIKSAVESSVLGGYVESTSPIVRIISYVLIQVTRAKLRV